MNNFKGPVIILLLFVLISLPVLAEQPDFELTASSSLLMEVDTGEILFSKNEHHKLPPASMSKIMTMILVMEAVEDGRANLGDKILVSERAASMGGSQVYLEPGEEITLENAMKAIAISSANDACVAVAEYIYGTEKDFIKKMNEKADKLNLKDTYYYNTNGLPPSDPEVTGNYTSAYDLAILTNEIYRFPKVFEWTSTWIDYIRDGEFVLNNTNRLVRHYKGVNGLKTGYTQEAGFCVTCTAEKNDLKFISVIMNAESSKKRFLEATKLLSYGYNSFTSMEIAENGEIIKKILIKNARNQQAQVIVPEKLAVPVKKGEEEKISKEIIIEKNLKAPMEKGDKAGKIIIYKGNLKIKEAELIIDRDVEKASIFQIIMRILKNLYIILIKIFI